jgi:penicillin-binding protein 1A
VEGGSTITQQLVRNLYLEDPEDTLKRKIIEAHLANDEEERHSKDWILTSYLNTASTGRMRAPPRSASKRPRRRTTRSMRGT